MSRGQKWLTASWVCCMLIAVVAGHLYLQPAKAQPAGALDVVVLPDRESKLLTLYAPAGKEVDLLIPIRYCYDRARITRIIRHDFDQMSERGAPAQPDENLAKLDLEAESTHDGRAIRARFVMPDSPASLQIYYHAPWGSPRWGPNAGERARYADIHLVPESMDFEQWIVSGFSK